jgi:Xaa-Pro aminopeptidase
MFEKGGCCTDAPPICAVNAHSADPHYSPERETSSSIRDGDFILIDVWCKLKEAGSVYADITRVAVAADQATPKQQQVFDVVRAGRDAAMALLEKRLGEGRSVRGWEVDRVCRDAIGEAGFGAFFTHRTGHSIHEKDHGDGANIDDFETKEERQLLPGSCFSIEPGVYLPGEFGIRLEDDVYIDPDGKRMHVTPGLQQKIVCLSSI